MRIFNSLKVLSVGLVVALSMVLSAVPVSAATASDGLMTQFSQNGTWADAATAAPGSSIGALLKYQNLNKSGQKSVQLKSTLPRGASIVPGSAYLYTPAVPAGAQQADTLATTGIATGLLKPGETAFIQYMITLPAANKLACGVNRLENRASGVSQSGGRSYSASSKLVIKRDCSTPATPTPPTTPTPEPKYSCDAFDVTVSGAKAWVIQLDWTAEHGARFNGVSFNWGDGYQSAVMYNPDEITHTYTATKRYVIIATVHFYVNGRDVIDTCRISKQVTIPAPVAVVQTDTTVHDDEPTAQVASATTTADDEVVSDEAEPATDDAKSLVNTGPGSIVMIFLTAVIVGIVGSRLVLYRLLRA